MQAKTPSIAAASAVVGLNIHKEKQDPEIQLSEHQALKAFTYLDSIT